MRLYTNSLICAYNKEFLTTRSRVSFICTIIVLLTRCLIARRSMGRQRLQHNPLLRRNHRESVTLSDRFTDDRSLSDTIIPCHDRFVRPSFSIDRTINCPHVKTLEKNLCQSRLRANKQKDPFQRCIAKHWRGMLDAFIFNSRFKCYRYRLLYTKRGSFVFNRPTRKCCLFVKIGNHRGQLSFSDREHRGCMLNDSIRTKAPRIHRRAN